MLHRYGSVAAALAMRLLSMRPGDRLDSVSQLATEFGTGRGTVQTALRLLTAEGAVSLTSHGKTGSYIRALDQPKLLERAGLSAIIGAMPVAYSLRFQGLATGLTRAFEEAALPLVLAQVRGGRNRIHFLRTGRCDFAIVSRLAWQQVAGDGDLHLLTRFGPGSNVGDHVLIFASRYAEGITDGMRVGVDSSSYDHVRLTQEECQGRSVALVETSYAQVVPRLLAGELDAALWDTGVPLPPGHLRVMPRRHRVTEADPNTEAVLLVRQGPRGLDELLAKRVSVDTVTALQRRVVAGEEQPFF